MPGPEPSNSEQRWRAEVGQGRNTEHMPGDGIQEEETETSTEQ